MVILQLLTLTIRMLHLWFAAGNVLVLSASFSFFDASLYCNKQIPTQRLNLSSFHTAIWEFIYCKSAIIELIFLIDTKYIINISLKMFCDASFVFWQHKFWSYTSKRLPSNFLPTNSQFVLIKMVTINNLPNYNNYDNNEKYKKNWWK